MTTKTTDQGEWQKSERGEGLAEYIIIAMLIAVIAIPAVKHFQKSSSCKYHSATGRMEHLQDEENGSEDNCPEEGDEDEAEPGDGGVDADDPDPEPSTTVPPTTTVLVTTSIPIITSSVPTTSIPPTTTTTINNCPPPNAFYGTFPRAILDSPGFSDQIVHFCCNRGGYCNARDARWGDPEQLWDCYCSG